VSLQNAWFINYAPVAVGFQLRNMAVFPSGMLRLNEARRQRMKAPTDPKKEAN